MKHSVSLLALWLGCMAHVQGKPLLLEGDLDQWHKVIIHNETQYAPVMDMEQGVVIRAESVNAASGYQLAKDINLIKTPVLQWQWALEQTPTSEQVAADGTVMVVRQFDETQAQGNDFALRLIVSKSSVFSTTKAIHYVWSHSQPLESSWSIDAHNKVLVVGGEQQKPRQWQTVFRHIQKDWQALFGEKIEEINSITIMTDSDQIQGHAVGYYGDMQTLAIKNMAENEP